MKTVIIVLFLLTVFCVFYAMYKSGHIIKNLATSIFRGIASLMAVNVLGLITGVTIAVNWYTLSAVCLLGLPSTIALVLLDAFLI